MVNTGPGNRRSAVAFVAATILVVQAFLSAWAGAAMAAQPMFDAFGNPLCISDTVRDSGAPGDDHGKLPSCCTLGCSAVSPLLAPPGDVVAAGLALSVSIARAPAARTVPIVAGLDHDPGSPRAPPLHV